MHHSTIAAVAIAILLAAATARGQARDEGLRRLDGQAPLPRSLSCGPFADYQQPLDDEGSHSSFGSDERLGLEMSESTVEVASIVPVPGLSIDGMRLWGLSVSNMLTNCFDDDDVPYNVRFYRNQAGAPGTQVGPTATAVPTRTDTGVQFLFPGLTIQQFDFQFVPPVDNAAGDISWIGAQRQLGEPDCLFHWIDETTEEFDDLAFWIGSGAVDVDMSICLALTLPLDLSITGNCPGPVTVTISNAPPSSEVAVVAAATNSGFTKGGLLCNGTVLEIGEPFQLPPIWVPVDETGSGSGNMTLQSNRCWLEALATTGCQTSGALLVE